MLCDVRCVSRDREYLCTLYSSVEGAELAELMTQPHCGGKQDPEHLTQNAAGLGPPDYSQFQPFPAHTSHLLYVGQPGAPMQMRGSSSGTLPSPLHFQHFTFFISPSSRAT